MQPNPKWRGDPTFLPDVLRAFGVKVKTLDGWLNRGHGDFGAIQGIIIHHIGSDRYDPWGIARHPSLGLCSQIHLSREGVATLCGVGIAYHAGKGSYPGWPTNDANRVSIGIEAESNGTSPWPAAELDAYYRICAAILWFLGKRATTNTLLTHKEYSFAAQGKWDPGGIDASHFRKKVNEYIDNPPFKKVVLVPSEKTQSQAQKAATVAEPFDKITRRFKSRVDGSNYEGKPIDYLLNTNRHAFIAEANTEVILERLDALEKKLDNR